MTSPDPYANAYTMLYSVLQQWGLEGLATNVRGMLEQGDQQDIIPLKLRETDQYKKRFAGNIARQKAGLPVLSEAEYLSTETALKSVVRRYVGSGTYDTQDNLTKWLGSDLSPQELNDRMTSYQKQFLSQPQEVKDAWASHGLTPGDAIRSIMDPTVNEGTLRRTGTVYALGSQAYQAYHDESALDVGHLSGLVDRGVTDSQDTRNAFQQVAGRYQNEDRLARAAGETLTRNEQENAALLNDPNAMAKRDKILRTELASHNENFLGGKTTLGRETAGSY